MVGILMAREYIHFDGRVSDYQKHLQKELPGRLREYCISNSKCFLFVNMQTPLGPPFALVQGTLEALGTTFKRIPAEACPTIKRGSVAWVGSGLEFFISLANHPEWKKAYTLFGVVLPEDMEIVEKIVQFWNNINVSILEKLVPLMIQRMRKSVGDT